MTSFWDGRFAGDDYAYGESPNAFLAAQAYRFQPGMRALAVADGEGRNGVWLAEQGLDVLSIDRSEVGLSKAQSLAAKRGICLRTLQADLLSWAWPKDEFDLVASIFIHFKANDRIRMHHAYGAALKKGGLVVLVAFTPQQLELQTGGPEQPELLYTAEELRSDFSEMEILYLQENVSHLHEGKHHCGMAATVHLVARARK